MYLLAFTNNVDNLSVFKKKAKEDKPSKVKGVAQLAAGGYVGQQAIRSGVPRALGVRLESHSTTRKNAKEILKNGGILDPDKSGSGAIRALENNQGLKDITDVNKAKGKVYITGLHKDAKDRVINGITMKADDGNPLLNVISRKSQRAGYRASAGIDWDKVNNKGTEAYNKELDNDIYRNNKQKVNELEELTKKSKSKFQGVIGGKNSRKIENELNNAKSVVKGIEDGANNKKLVAGGMERIKQTVKNSLLPTGKSLYIGGSDDYFDKTFQPDFDDPKAMYTTNKVKVSGNRLSATLDALKREGGGNKLKGAVNLIKANKGRVGAGLAIAGLGGLAATKLVTSGIKNVTGKRDERNDKGRKRGKYK